jgi:hypothetical protein
VKIIDRSGDDLNQMGQGLPYPQVQVKGHFRGYHPQFLITPVKEQKVYMAAVFQGINYCSLLRELLQPFQMAGVHRNPFEERVQGIAQQESRAAGQVPGIMVIISSQPTGQATERLSQPATGFFGTRGVTACARFFHVGVHHKPLIILIP